MRFPLTLCSALVLQLFATAVQAVPLTEARIRQIVNDVRVIDPRKGARPAAVQDAVRDDLGVRTGIQSRAELLFQDETLTRLGAETFFSFKTGTRDMSLERGTMLLQVPKDHGGARIRTASVTASITGTTIMIEHQPNKHVKVLVLEGSLRLSANGRLGESLLLTPGKMVIMKPDARRVPEPVTVDLRKVMKTSSLIDPAAFAGKSGARVAALPSERLIENEIAIQQRSFQSRDLVATNLVIAGSGTEVTAASPETLAAIDRGALPKAVGVDTSPESIRENAAIARRTSPDATDETDETGVNSSKANGLAAASASPTPAIETAKAGIDAASASVAANRVQQTAANRMAIAAPDFTADAAATADAPVADVPAAADSGATIAAPDSAATIDAGAGAAASPSGMRALTVINSGVFDSSTGSANSGASNSGAGSSGAGSGSSNSGTGNSGATNVVVAPPAVSNTTPTSAPAFIAVPNPYVIDDKTTINTPDQTITTKSVVDAGGLYKSPAVSGPASTYLFDTPSAFDAATNLDANFSVKSGGAAPSAGVAVYRFSGLEIRNSPTFTSSGGPSDIALVSQTGITRSSGGVWKLDGLRSLFFGSANGPITVQQEIKTEKLTTAFKYLQLYARGATGTVTLDGNISLPLASLYVDAEQGITVTSGASITAFNTIFNTPGTIVIDKSPTSATLKLNAGTGIQFTSALANANVEMTAPVLQTTKDLSALTGFLDIGAGGIQAGGAKLSGFKNIDVVGNVVADSVSVSSALNIGGTYRTGAADGKAALTAGTLAIAGGIDLTGANGVTGGTLTINATDVNVSSTGINGIKADGSDGLLALVAGGAGGTVNLGTSSKPITNSVTVDRPITATTGANGTGALLGGPGGTVNVIAKGTIAVNSSVKVSDSALARASRTGGTIKLDSRKTSGTAISVSNSGQLLSLLNAVATGSGGTITFVSSGGEIVVNGGTVQADKGTVDIRNNGTGNVTLTNAALRGNVVKVGALGANGQLLVGGGSINADTTLKLYGGTSNGQVRFTDDVTLGGAGAKTIAGKTVTIDNGKTVTIGGSSAAKVYTDNAKYTGSGGNGSTTGNFGGAGATTTKYSSKPAF